MPDHDFDPATGICRGCGKTREFVHAAMPESAGCEPPPENPFRDKYAVESSPLPVGKAMVLPEGVEYVLLPPLAINLRLTPLPPESPIYAMMRESREALDRLSEADLQRVLDETIARFKGDPPADDWTPWKAEYLSTGGPGPRQFAGWYATRRTRLPVPPGHGMMCSFSGPFDSEAQCVGWCDAENLAGVPAADTPHVVEG